MNEKIKIIDPEHSGDELAALLSDGAAIPVVVTGSSMLPFLKEGTDTVWLEKKSAYKRGRIVFFRRENGSFVLHRVRKCLPDGRMLMNGDAQSWCEIINPDQALAEVVAVTRKGKTRRADCFVYKLRDALWYPTRFCRPFIFAVYGKLHRSVNT
ncbi:MAG: S24/S26 family peptidase [Eubacteriales bacterium]